MPSPFAFSSPDEAIRAWMERVPPIQDREPVGLSHAAGRVVAKPLHTDRPSPPCSVSAMDGYVLRHTDLTAGRMDVACEVAIGKAPPAIPRGRVGRIFTGAPVPDECDVVLKREDVREHEDHIEVETALLQSTKSEQHIRRLGENAPAGTEVLSAGRAITTATASALAAFGCAEVECFRRLRIGIITTGSEIRRVNERDLQPWEIRNSNGPAIQAFLSCIPWIDMTALEHAIDDAEIIAASFRETLARCDAVLLTGGVSMGDYDFVTGTVKNSGAEVIFHKLPMRPGKPVLAAVGQGGQMIFGLPGNPLSVMVALRTLGYPMLQHKAGIAAPTGSCGDRTLREGPGASLDLWWYRPVRVTGHGTAELIPIRGSGDVTAAALSDGIVRLPPRHTGVGPWPFWHWAPR